MDVCPGDGGGSSLGGGGGGMRDGGRVSGRGMLFLRSTTRCMATLNSSSDRAPSFVTSASCLQTRNYNLENFVMYLERRQRYGTPMRIAAEMQ